MPLAEQDVALWNLEMIDAAEGLLLRASSLGSSGATNSEGALQSAHVHRRRTGRDNWAEIVRIYDALMELSGSPVVAINRALALTEVEGGGRRGGVARTSDERLTVNGISAVLGGSRGVAGSDGGRGGGRITRMKSRLG